MKTGGMSAKQLDRTLKKLFMDVARRELNDLKSGRIDVAEDMLMRGQKLRSTSVSDDRVLLRLLGDVAFRRRTHRGQGLQSRFDEALTQFDSPIDGVEMFTRVPKNGSRQSQNFGSSSRLSLESGIDPDLLLRKLDGTAAGPEVTEVSTGTTPKTSKEATGQTAEPAKGSRPENKPAR